MNTELTKQFANVRSSSASRLWLGVVAAVVLMSPGCTIFHPLRGVPASYLPDEFEGPSRSGKNTINLGLLTRTQPRQHLVAAGDVLSIYVPRVLGRLSTEIRDVGIEPPINTPNTQDDPPTLGYPITVRDDHTISLPQLPPINVHGMTIRQVEETIRRAYTVEHQIIQPEEAMVLVSLQRPRVYRVLVVRQETSNELTSGTGGAGRLNPGASKRGSARTVTLKAYENDVMHALALAEGADGLPGLDAKNTIYIIRRRQEHSQQSICPQPDYIQPAPIMQMGFQSPVVQSSSMIPSSNAVAPRGGYYGSRQAEGNPLVAQSIRQGQGHSMSSPYDSPHTKPVLGKSGHSLSVMPVPNAIVQAQHTQMSPYGNMGMQPQYQQMPGMPTMAQQPQIQSPQMPPSPMMQQYPNMQQPQYPMQPQPLPLQEPVLTGPNSMSPDIEPQWGSMLADFDPTIENPNVVKIPVRLADGERPHFTEQDITLEDGDIVFIESRETEVFYAGGLLGGGQFTLPRDYDLHVLEALAIAEGRTNGGGSQLRSIGGVSALNQDVAISASRLVILRKLPIGQRISIEVDLHKAMRYQQEDILIQPGDMLILSYTFPEAVAAFTQRFLLEGALIGIATSSFTGGNSGR